MRGVRGWRWWMGSQGITIGIATVRGLRVGAKMVVWIYSWSKQTRTRVAFSIWILVGKVSMLFGVPITPCRMLASKSVLVGGGHWNHRVGELANLGVDCPCSFDCR